MADGLVWKIAAGVAIGLTVVTLADRAYTAWQLHEVAKAFASEAAKLSASAAGALDRVHADAARRRADDQRKADERAAQERAAIEAKRLRPDERCVAGTVVRVTSAGNTSSYVQVLGAGAKPERCAGTTRL